MNSKLFLLAVLSVFFICPIASAQVEEITLSTYYPAPYGEYEEMAAEKLFADKVIIGNMDVDGDGDYSDSDDINAMGVGSLLIENNLGIGTAGPARLVHVSSSSTGGTYLLLDNTDTGGRKWSLISTGSAQAGGAGLFAINDDTAGTRVLSINSSGNVGIGTTEPVSKLDIYDSYKTANNGQLEVRTSDSAAQGKGGQIVLTGYYSGTSEYARFARIKGAKENATAGNYASYLSFETRAHGGNFVEQVRIDSSGNVGIGTTSPTSAAAPNGQTTGNLDVNDTWLRGAGMWASEAGGIGSRTMVSATNEVTNTSGSWVDMPDMSVTFQAADGNKVLISFSCIFLHTEGHLDVSFRIVRDATQLTEMDHIDSIGDFRRQTMSMQWLDTADGNSHTYKIQWKTSGATARAYARTLVVL